MKEEACLKNGLLANALFAGMIDGGLQRRGRLARREQLFERGITAAGVNRRWGILGRGRIIRCRGKGAIKDAGDNQGDGGSAQGYWRSPAGTSGAPAGGWNSISGRG
jgi:hypothetical protein